MWMLARDARAPARDAHPPAMCIDPIRRDARPPDVHGPAMCARDVRARAGVHHLARKKEFASWPRFHIVS
jgi:hypothetical protein